jgi:hypothetical protein
MQAANKVNVPVRSPNLDVAFAGPPVITGRRNGEHRFRRLNGDGSV